MFHTFFTELRAAKVPVSIREYLTLLEGVEKGVADESLDGFYYLSRTALIKDERDLDKFDQVFSHVFRGMDYLSDLFGQDEHEIPADWLQKLAEKHLSPEEMEAIKGLGDLDKIMEALKERLDNQDKRHEGGNKNIGTAGTSPFGAYGYNPEGVRIGQKEGRHGKAVKVWDKRQFKNLDGDKEIPYEIAMRGGSVEHWNEEAGAVWLQRLIEVYPHLVWINPTAEKYWEYSQSTNMIQQIIGAERMFPMTLSGLENAMRELAR